MKKLNLLLISVLFSSLLIGCGMKGPLYRAPEKAPKIETETTQKIEIKADTAKETDNVS